MQEREKPELTGGGEEHYFVSVPSMHNDSLNSWLLTREDQLHVMQPEAVYCGLRTEQTRITGG